MVDPKVTREKAIRTTKTNLILDAALRVFSEQGFHDTRLEDIAAAAGFSKASLYNYYEDKEAIFLSLAIREYQRLNAILHEVITAKGSFEQKLKKILEAIFRLFGEHFAIILTISNFRTANILTCDRLHNQHEDRTKEFTQLHEGIAQLFVTLIQSGKAQEEIHCTIDDSILAQYVGALIRGVLMEWKIAGKIGDVQKEINNLVVFITRGMCCY